MADRGQIPGTQPGRGGIPIVIDRENDGDIPAFETPSNRLPSALNSRVLSGGGAAQRQLTVNATQACVPVILGGFLTVGGYVIFQKQVGGFYYVDFAICEGPLSGLGSIINIKVDGKAQAAIGWSQELHYGAAGDTTSSLITAVESSYTIPEGVAHVVLKFPWPNQTSGDYNPFNFQCDVKGILAPTISGGVFGSDAWTDNPVRLALKCLTDEVFGGGFDPASYFVNAEWEDGQDVCDFDIDPGAGTTKRWQISLRIDQQDSLENWITQILDHCAGHLRHDGEKYGLWMDTPRAVAQDSDGNDFLFTDQGDASTLSAKPVVVEKARAEIPTVVIVDFTSAADNYIDASVQVPSGGPSGDWIELRVSRPGITTIERARRMAVLVYNLHHLARDITLEPWMDGVLPQEGDRITCQSGRVIPGTETPPDVSGAVAGIEHLVVDEQAFTPTGTILRCSLYRDVTFSDTIDTSGGPTPPGQTPNTPDPPTSLVLTDLTSWENGVLVARIKADWTPADEPYSTVTKVTYSRDGVNFFLLGEFLDGPVFLENAVLNVQHTFKLYTVRTSTGQVSSALTGTITPDYVDQTMSEVVQGQILPDAVRGGTLKFTGQIPTVMHAARNQAPAAALTAAANAGGIVPIGTYKLWYSRVTAETETHLSPLATVTTDAGHRILAYSNVLDSDGAGGGTGVLYKKIYISVAGGSTPYFRDRMEVGVTSGTLNTAVVNTPNAELENPPTLDGIDHWNVYDDFGSPSDPPLYARIPVLSPPNDQARLSLGPIIHPEAGTGLPRVDLIVRTVDKAGAVSSGKSYSAVNTIGFPKVAIQKMTFAQRSLSLVNGNNNDIDPSETATNIITGPSAAFAITGIANGEQGDRVTIVNPTTQTLTIKHESASSSAANRILVPGAADKAFANQHTTLEFEYDGATSRWRLIGS